MTGATASTLTAGDFEFVRALVHEHAAIVLEPSKTYLVESRLAPLVRAIGADSIGDLVARLRTGHDAQQLRRRVVDAMTTNETSWYRDLSPFEALETTILPQLIAARQETRALNIWSAACSSGQEPYSVAMLLRERFPQLAGWNVRIIATDISAEMLGRAAAGTYSQLEVNRGLPSAHLVKYFTRRGASWQIRDDIRAMVEFRAMNLAQPWGFLPPIDVLLLRNVLIYFDVATKREILRRAREVLRPDGYLLLGTAETTLSIDDAFTRVTVGRTTVYQAA
ncbi:MAG TPA: protein-glutamate O-methyltransferase CheR [Egibacteraceae bacterium]